MTNAILTTAALVAALVLTAAGLSSGTSKGINPVQHSEGAVTTQNASKGINPVQHSE